MMASRTVKAGKPVAVSELIFRWRGSQQPVVPKLLAIALVGVAFLLLVTTVRIRVDAPEKSAPRRASVIFLRDDVEGRALTLRAREGGPFPSRFKPSEWEGLVGIETAAMDAVRFQPPAYVPVVEDLPAESQLQPLELATKGVSFFPNREFEPVILPDPGQLKPAPVLYPLSGVTAEILPRELPTFGAEIDAAMTANSWRFLVRLSPDGTVAECVSLGKGAEPGTAELDAWLRRLQFKPDPAKPFRWISVGIGFTNQAADGTDAR